VALKELTDAGAYHLPRAQRLVAAGDLKDALAELDTALEANPDDGRLLSLRAQVRLDMPRKGGIDAATQKQIRADAEAAKKDSKTASEGNYVLGRLEEELGNLDEAERDYREALKAHQGSVEEASRYIIGLARVLQRERGAAAEPAPAEPEQPKAAETNPKVGRRTPETPAGAVDVRTALLALALAGFQAPGAEEPLGGDERLRESIELAKRLLTSSDPKVQGQGYLLLGRAYTRQGKRTEGLQMYVKGMQLAYPGAPTKDLTKLVEEHPAFQQAEVTGMPNAYIAEQYFGKGLHAYWSGQYGTAEEEFRRALAAYDRDARYHYYLGLAQTQQGKQEAARYQFEQGVRLEAANQPGPVMVNASLERLQGDLRQRLDSYRQNIVSGR
jgi:tetratricopeptide (TPR) repeat protein